MTSSEYRKLSMLLSNIKNGSRDSFAEIYRMYEKKVYFLLCKILRSKSAAKQLCVEFFDYIYLQSSDISNAAAFEKWLYNALFFKSRRYLTEHSPEVFGDYTDTDSPDGNAIEGLLARDSDEMLQFPDGIDVSVDMMQTVDSILSEMPQKLRNTVLMHYFCGFDFSEIASCEHISVQAAKNRLYKAHIRLETEEHKYTEIGYDCYGMLIFMPDILTTMAESIVIPADIASGVTSRTGINCFDRSESSFTDENSDTSAVRIPSQKPGSNYMTTAYATAPRTAAKRPAQDVSPTVKVLMALIAILIIIGGTVAVVLAIQGSRASDDKEGSVINNENTTASTTIEITTKETTTETTTAETTTEETTTAETTTAETTTAETTTAETTTAETTTAETTTAETTTAEPVQQEPEDGNDSENIIDDLNSIF